MSLVLCIDIGGTRIKSATLSETTTLAELRALPVFSMRTQGWLNTTLPELLSVDQPDSLLNRSGVKGDFSAIAIGVPGIVENDLFTRADLTVPEDLKQQFSQYTDKPVTLVKDADAWMLGAIACAQMTDHAVGYPAISLIFGTGVGLSVSRDGKSFSSLEISALASDFPSISAVSGVSLKVPWQVHDILGKPFLEWVTREKQHWSYSRIRQEFSSRVHALVKDLFAALPLPDDGIKTVFVGGGNSEYVAIESLVQALQCDIHSLPSDSLALNPDIVPLIGLRQVVSNRD